MYKFMWLYIQIFKKSKEVLSVITRKDESSCTSYYILWTWTAFKILRRNLEIGKI